MTTPTPQINPDATLIPDKAEVWLALKDAVDAKTNGVSDMMPDTPDDDLDGLGWEFCGLIDNAKGIPLDPSGEVKEYDAFGHPIFRVKFRKGKVVTGFTLLEENDVTAKVVLPGSETGKLGIPKNTQIYVLYRFIDLDTGAKGNRVWVSLRPALAELKSHGGIIDGELSFAEIAVHHTADANRDVFQVIEASEGP